jgi:hypothetical protein
VAKDADYNSNGYGIAYTKIDSTSSTIYFAYFEDITPEIISVEIAVSDPSNFASNPTIACISYGVFYIAWEEL